MAPKSCKIKGQPSKLAKLHNAKKQKKANKPTRPAPSRAYPTCQHPQWTPSGYYWIVNNKTHRGTYEWVSGHQTPCDCARTIPTVPVKPAASRRNPGRMDGVTWNGSTFLSANRVDGDPISERHTGEVAEDDGNGYSSFEEDVHEGGYSSDESFRSLHTVSLLAMARPAKPKGTAKHFEMVETPDRVVVLEDEDFESYSDEDFDDDDWEDLYLEGRGHRRERDTYSAILQKR